MTLSARVDVAFDINMKMASQIYEDHSVTLFYPNGSAPNELVQFNGATSYTYTSATWADNQQVNITVRREGRYYIPYKVTSPFSQRVKEGAIGVNGTVLPDLFGQFNTIRTLIGGPSCSFVRCGKIRGSAGSIGGKFRFTLLSGGFMQLGRSDGHETMWLYDGNPVSPDGRFSPAGVFVQGASLTTGSATLRIEGLENTAGLTQDVTFSKLYASNAAPGEPPAQADFDYATGIGSSVGADKPVPGGAFMQPITVINGKALQVNAGIPNGWIANYLGRMSMVATYSNSPSGSGILHTIGTGEADVNVVPAYAVTRYNAANYPKYRGIPSDMSDTSEGSCHLQFMRPRVS